MPPALQPATGDRRARSQAARLSQVQVTRGGAGVLSVLRQDRPEELARLVFERLRDALRAALDAATPPGNLRDLARQMREAVVEAKVSVQETRAAVTRAEGELVVERQRLADAERRGRLAAQIQDAETVAVAQPLAARRRARRGGRAWGGSAAVVGGGAAERGTRTAGPPRPFQRPGSRRSIASAWGCSSARWQP